jgi:hypothetical protein
MTTSAIPILQFWLETPAGDKILPGTAGTSYIVGKRATYYRFNLPVAIGSGAHSGKWHAVLGVDPKYYKRYLSSIGDNNKDLYQSILAHGITYNLNVHASSVLNLKARVHQNSMQPVPKNRAIVVAQLTYPDNSKILLNLKATSAESGIYEATIKAGLNGVYTFRVMASGTTWRGRKYTREQIATGGVWRGGDNPPPTSGNDPDTHDQKWCELISCLFNSKIISDDVIKKWEANGINITNLRKCLARWCRGKIPAGFKQNNLKNQLTAVASLADPAEQQSELIKIIAGMTELDIKDIANSLTDTCDCKK